mmetsp:Transcript_13195/g.37455  ORF Transcript_13195/g.37455 Transcript_13195/m.37455 type:complete len:252 (+) Transcript_13195:756-1511(+)
MPRGARAPAGHPLMKSFCRRAIISRHTGHRRHRRAHLRHMQAWPQGTATTCTGLAMQIEHSDPRIPSSILPFFSSAPAADGSSGFEISVRRSAAGASFASASSSLPSSPEPVPPPSSRSLLTSSELSLSTSVSSSPSENTTPCRSWSKGSFSSPPWEPRLARSLRASRLGHLHRMRTKHPTPKSSARAMPHTEAALRSAGAWSQWSPPQPAKQTHFPESQMPWPPQYCPSHSMSMSSSVKQSPQHVEGDKG